ncbi:unnamed protein product [Phytomonas sp. Hart1]|nr:unnamed protein product [Phytomonas sp. Hart1]|eukprot:CCW68422.1 unnamed protein product [Phytomonas sp. isolate Hart1]
MLSACGIQCFWTDLYSSERSEGVSPVNISLTAKLKAEPEDFIVVEIDPKGQRTNDENYHFFNSLTTDGAGGRTDIREDRGTFVRSGINDDEEAEKRFIESQFQHTNYDGIGFDEAAPSHFSLSGRIIFILRELEVFIQRDHCEALMITDRAEHLTAEELPFLIEHIKTGRPNLRVHWWEKEWVLRIPGSHSLDKIQRRLFYNYIRSCFPHVRSRILSVSDIPTVSSLGDAPSKVDVERESEDSDLQAAHLLVGIDPHYIFLTFLFGRKVSETLIEWSRLHQQDLLNLETPDIQTEWQAIEQYLCIKQEAQSSLTSTVSSSLSRIHVGTSFQTHFRSSLFPLADDRSRSANQVDCISEKDLRRLFHDHLRRFYPFVKCHVSDGKLTLKRLVNQQPNSRKRPRLSVSDEAGKLDERGSSQQIFNGEVLHSSNGHNTTWKAYTYLIVFKRNLDVMEMKQLVAEYFSVSPSCVCTAGLKDKKAITYQRVSVPGWYPDLLLLREKEFPPQRMVLPWLSDPQRSYARIHNIASEPYSSPLQIGHLRGNYFVIRLRQVKILHDVQEVNVLGPKNGLQSIRDLTIRTLQERFQCVHMNGFVNYFGQQRFSESITDIQDHTGLHLFAGRWPEAVKSIYRACPQIHEAFPDLMEARHVPKNARDAQIMTNALHRTYRMYFSEHPLTRADVQEKSALWCLICQKAITESVPFAHRSMWIHAAQSLYFNIAASYVAGHFRNIQSKHHEKNCVSYSNDASGFNMRAAQDLKLPLGGYHTREGRNDSTRSSSPQVEDQSLWLAEVERHALEVLALPREVIFGQSKVAGVPVPGSWRQLIVVPQDAQLEIIEQPPSFEVLDPESVDAVVSFSLPSSSYATICLREILHNSNWF